MRIAQKLCLPILVGLLVVLSPAIARADAPAPGWEAFGRTAPTVMEPGHVGDVWVYVYNTGAVEGGEGVLRDTLPKGLTATGGENCSGTTVVTCALPAPGGNPQASLYPGEGQPDAVKIPVTVAPGMSGEGLNSVVVEGGGATDVARTSFPVRFGTQAPGPGFSGFDMWASNTDGSVDTQAGSHPFEVTLAFSTNTVLNEAGEELLTGEPRDLDFRLPPGLVGNPNAVPQCPRADFDEAENGEKARKACPASTRIGFEDIEFEGGSGVLPIYNIVPPPGVAAQFGFTLSGITVLLNAKVRSGGDYGITEHVFNVPERKIRFSSTTIWGNPSEEGLDVLRRGGSPGCVPGPGGGCVYTGPQEPFLTTPTSCEGPQPIFGEIIGTWEDLYARPPVAEIKTHNSEGTQVGFTGCSRLSHFNPTATIAPDTTAADTPAGLGAEVRVPQGVNPEQLSTAGLKDTTVTLPPGVVINPGQATGLVACPPGKGPGTENLPASTGEGESEEWDGPPECPSASKVGTDEINTPLLADPLVGNVYILQNNPPHLQLLVAASADGVNLKLIGEVNLNEATGQITTTFKNTPDFPFTVFKLAFSGGAQAALATPTRCNTAEFPAYTSEAAFTPWSSPFVAEALSLSSFEITSGPAGGGSCGATLPFSPTLTAGSTTDQAGGYTNFTMLLQRGDGQQRIDGLQFKAPAGLTGFLSHVPLCTNAQAEANACPAASKIGHTVVESGPGPYPLVIPEAGQEPAPIYLTEGYGGAPFGLSIVVPLHVGPFTLETQRVRASIAIDPYTSQLTVTTNPLPQEVAGIPTDLREVDAVIERPEFMVNPTNCKAQAFTGTAYGTPPPGQGGPQGGAGGSGSSAPLSYRFQVGACQALKFEPKFTVSTAGKTSKANGASLTAKVSYPNVPQGTDADIGYVKIELPKQLPSRLTTLQRACTNAQFEANPAACPSESKIGYATVHTPLLPVPLTGPAIFVSHGGEAFPSLTVVLQGDGVTVDIVGTTFISKAGITSTTFKTVPDDPFSTFELTLPQGKFSALTTNVPTKAHYSLCGQKLTMPNELVGQNGAVLKQTTAVRVMGCPPTRAKVKALTRSQKLQKALKACRKQKGSKRQQCEKAARRRLGPVKKAKRGKR
jgi:hypothetical protein